jgi:multiple sugar transport system substrate-binding protein
LLDTLPRAAYPDGVQALDKPTQEVEERRSQMGKKLFNKLHRFGFFGVIILLTMMFVFQVSPENAEAKDVTVTWATIGGFYTDWARDIAKGFEAKTGIHVKIVDIDFAQMYEKEVIEMVGGTGAYDIVTYDVGWKAEWASSGYLRPLDDLIAKSDPKEIAFDDIHPALVELTTRFKGKVYGLPYYSFTMGYFARWDLFTDPGEQGAFKKKYGYDLDIPQTYEQMADIAEFFDRKPGEKLAGKTLKKHFYGIGLMAGRFPQIQDENMSIAWTRGAQLIKDDGSPGCTDPLFLKAVNFYVHRLLPHAPPGALTSAYDEVVAQMRQGLIAQTAAFYLDQWPNIAKTEQEVPGAKIAIAAPPGANTWVGAFGLGLSRDSKHPKEAWEFLKYLAGPIAQRKFAEMGGTTCRVSLLKDKSIRKHSANAHFPVLLQILDHVSKCQFYPNYYYVPQGGKIYDEETTYFSAAASGQQSVNEAMENLAKAIERHCNGKCEVANADLGKGYHPTPCPFKFDKSAWAE